MTANRLSRWTDRRYRAGAVLLLLAALAGGTFLWQPASHADATSFSLQTHAYHPAKGDLQIAVSLADTEGKNLAGQLEVALLNSTGKVIGKSTKQVLQPGAANGYGFTFKVNRKDAGALQVRTKFAGQTKTAKLADVTLAKGHETALTAGKEFFTGSSTALHCAVHGVRSLSETVPLAGADVLIRLRDKDNKSRELFKGTTGAKGNAIAAFTLPDLPDGNYTLEVETRSPLGEEKLTQNVRIRSDAKILLVSDKPIYQPGHMMHIRALALRPYDLKPVANTDLLFEVEDSKGNKVFKKTYKTSDFGVASVDFQLADEVNMGAYQIRATAGATQAQKTVEVKRYVLPKFKVNVKTAKKFYMPKETVEGSIQADYFFGKPIARSKVEITASTFDVAFRKFATWNGNTDDNGHVKFEIKLPDYFVGQPLQKGDALVKLDVKITDNAEQVVRKTMSYPVSDQPIKISLIPEGGKLVPDMENRVFAAAVYPDGSPAKCDVRLWIGKKVEGKPHATMKTNEVGLAEFKFTPKAKMFRQGGWAQQQIEMLGGRQIAVGGQKILVDLTVAAKDGNGKTAQTTTELNAQPLGDNVLLRLNKAIYQAGESMKMDVRTSAGLPTVYLDIIRGGQVLLSRWMEVNKGQAVHSLDLPTEVFGSLEVHAYQMLASGEIIRDSRVVYVQPRNDLNIKVQPSKKVFAPGENGRIRFLVTDAKGNPTAAALGVIVVDEAVYALQDLQPGLEKVYFTLQKELLKPQVQAKFKPADNLPGLIRQPALPQPRQQVAQALLTAVKVAPPKQWNVAPVFTRKQQMQGRLQQIGWTLWNYAYRKDDVLRFDKAKKQWEFRPNVLETLVKERQLNKQSLQGPFGEQMTIADLQKLDNNFKAENLATQMTLQRINQMTWWIINYTNQNRNKYFKNGKWELTNDVLQAAAKQNRVANKWLQDMWGNPLRLEYSKKEWRDRYWGYQQMRHYRVVSAGADGKLGTKDDLRFDSSTASGRFVGSNWWFENNGMLGLKDADRWGAMRDGQPLNFFRNERARALQRGAGVGGFPGQGGFGGGGGGLPGGAPVPQAAMPPGAPVPTDAAGMPEKKSQVGGGAPPRIRSYFPETMLWQPQLITNDRGIADMSVNFADSITTWRLSASANSKGGALGGVTVPLKVFQDFFVDIDLPVNWTQDDEVEFPVAVFNYLNQPQTVKIELKQGAWFNLLEGEFSRTLNLKPNEVTSVKFRIKANRIGNHPLTVMAYGSKKSDAVRRVIEVVPNGERKEVVINGSLKGNVSKNIAIPQDAIPDSYKMLVRIYPGMMSQVLEGTEGMLRLPGG